MRTNKVSLVLFLLFSGFASAFSPFFLKAANSDVIDPTGGATLTASFTDR